MSRVLAAILLAFVVFACGNPVNVVIRELPGGPNLPGIELLGKGGLVDDVAFKALLKSLSELVKNIRKTLEGLNVCPDRKADHLVGEHGHYEPSHDPDYETDHQNGYKSRYIPSYRTSHLPSYQPSYPSSYRPSYPSSYRPSYPSSYRPSYPSSYRPSYPSSYRPSYTSSYRPSYPSSYRPSYPSSYRPSYPSSYRPSYFTSHTPWDQYKRESEVSKVDMTCEILKPLMEALIKLLKQLEKTLGCMQGKEKGYKGDYKDCQ